MLNRRALLSLLLLLVLGAFAWGTVHLFQLRFAAGDVYPHYSSLRGDPLGARVYYESLDALGGARVRRFMESVDRLPHGQNTTLFIFGLPWNEMSATEEEYKSIDGFVRQGGRLVVTLYPELGRPRNFIPGTGSNNPAFKRAASGDEEPPQVNLLEKWGLGYAYVPTTRDGRLYGPVNVTRVEPGPIPASLSWHSALVLTNLDFPWRIIYARGTDPVMIERQHGSGAILIATDSYFVSNEALRKERAADLLAWLPGDGREVLFDETHLGVQQTPGVATLARRYGLHGGVAALLLLAGLFLWKNAVSFQPREPEAAVGLAVEGRESAAGFENLLRRGVPPEQLLQTSLNEWHKSWALDRRATPGRREQVRAVVEAFNAAEKPNPVDAYRQIAAILNRKT